jgi:hypothetical protein
MAEHLPRLCEAMCGNEHYACKDVLFRLTMFGSYHVRMYLDKEYRTFKLKNLRYLLNMFYIYKISLLHIFTSCLML